MFQLTGAKSLNFGFNGSTHSTAVMPPRLSLAFRPLPWCTAPLTSLPRFLLPCLQPQSHRSASILSSLSDNPSAYKKKIRRGRGPSSGKGKTSGRGHKGQKQHGKVPRGFNGGQTPLEVVHGIRGFTNVYVLFPMRIALNSDILPVYKLMYYSL